MMRTAILVDDFDKRLGSVSVAETTFVIKHGDGFYVRTPRGIRLAGGGIGVVFEPTEVIERNKLGAV